MPSVTVIIPVYNDARNLRSCLQAIRRSNAQPEETIVVDDGSTDESAKVAERFGARVLRQSPRRGQAAARNLGAREARSEIFMFVDADVELHPDAIERVKRLFEGAPGFAAAMGSYDDTPADQNFLSQYRNLMHCFVHQQARDEASTFWTGCGAVRRDAFVALCGFDESWRAVEDIEFGYRLIEHGYRIRLDRKLHGKHLKRWTLWGLIRTDVRDRAIPWTELILRDRRLPNDLNVSIWQRVAMMSVFAAVLLPAVAPLWSSLMLIGAAIAINAKFYTFLRLKRGMAFAIGAVPLHLLYYLYSGAGFAVGALRHLRRQTFLHGRARQVTFSGNGAPPLSSTPSKR